MRRYSPSQTETFLACPRKRAIRKLGWQPTRLGKKGLAAILGTAFAAGVGAYNMMRKEGAVPDANACAEIAFRIAQQHLAEADSIGLVTQDADLAQRNALCPRAQKAVRDYALNDPIPVQWVIRDVELTLAEWGNSRIDLGYENELGIGVLDYKTKLTLDARYFDRDVARYKHSEQRFMYPAAYGDYVGHPVYRFDILLCVLEPRFRAHLLPFIVNPTIQAEWLHDRVTTWDLMEATEVDGPLEPWMAAKHHDEFGPCEFETYCFDFKADADLARTSGLYTRKETA